MNRHHAESFRNAVIHIHKHCTLAINIFDIATKMEALHQKPYRSKYPRVYHEGQEDDNWHAIRDWRKQMTQTRNVGAATVYRNGVMEYVGKRYYMVGGLARPISDELFEAMGFDESMIIHITSLKMWYAIIIWEAEKA